MAKKYTAIIEKSEDGWYISEVVELPGCHTQAKNIDQLIERTKEAIMSYLGTDKQPMILINQNSIAKKRLSDIKNNRVIGKSKKELDDYLRKRGVKFERTQI